MAARPSRGPADVPGTTAVLPSSVNEPIPLISETDSSHVQRDIDANLGPDEIRSSPTHPASGSLRSPEAGHATFVVRSDPIQSDPIQLDHAPVVIRLCPQGAVGAGAVAGAGMSEAGEGASGVGWAGTASTGASAGAGAGV